MDTDQFSLCINGVFVGGTIHKPSLSIVCHIILVLEFGDGRDEHDVGMLVFQKSGNRRSVVNNVGLKQQEIVIADDVPTIVQCANVFGSSGETVAEGENAVINRARASFKFWLSKLRASFISGLALIECS